VQQRNTWACVRACEHPYYGKTGDLDCPFYLHETLLKKVRAHPLAMSNPIALLDVPRFIVAAPGLKGRIQVTKK
jgi:hypothetical protein